MNLKEFYEKKAKPWAEEKKKQVTDVGKVLVETVKENPMIGFMLLSSAKTIVDGVISAVNRSNEEQQKLCTTYDPYTGCNLTTTHELSNQEVLELSNRQQNGETKVEALNNMGLLK